MLKKIIILELILYVMQVILWALISVVKLLGNLVYKWPRKLYKRYQKHKAKQREREYARGDWYQTRERAQEVPQQPETTERERTRLVFREKQEDGATKNTSVAHRVTSESRQEKGTIRPLA